MSPREVYGKPVTPVAFAGDSVITDEHVPPTTGEYGVIVHRTDRDGPTIHRCESADERDGTLVPFYAYYTAVERVETFGPDLG